MAEQTPTVTLAGEPVTISYVADPAVGHGRFRLENHGSAAVRAVVESAWLEAGGERRPLAGISVFDVQEERSLQPDDIRVAPGAAATLLVGFPRIMFEPRFGEPAAVGVSLLVDGARLQALSPLRFIRRIPRDR